MKKVLFYILTLACVYSCHTDIDIDELITPQTKPQKAFETEFTKKYGTVSPELSWMTVSSDTLLADLSGLESDSFTIQVYTADPCADLDYCYLLAEYNNVSGNKDIVFDYPSGLNNVYVSAIDADNRSYTSRIDTRIEEEHKVAFDPESPDSVHFENKPMGYLMAFEGFTGDEEGLDFDYNDVIVEIGYVRGRDSLDVKAVAVGCDCAVQLAYRRKGNTESGEDEIIFEEVHDAMGYEALYDYVLKRLVYLKLNTGINKAPKKPVATTYLKELVNASITDIAPKIFATFTIPATKPKDETSSTAFLPAKKGVNYPQAILVADPTWEWAREGLLLSAAYSQFRPWIYGPEGNELWYGAKNWKEANSYYE